jgi:hypothetical protein
MPGAGHCCRDSQGGTGAESRLTFLTEFIRLKMCLLAILLEQPDGALSPITDGLGRAMQIAVLP